MLYDLYVRLGKQLIGKINLSEMRMIKWKSGKTKSKKKKKTKRKRKNEKKTDQRLWCIRIFLFPLQFLLSCLFYANSNS